MYDKHVRDIDEMANKYDVTTLIPASNTIIVKAAGDSKMIGELESYVDEHERVRLTWNGQTAEITA